MVGLKQEFQYGFSYVDNNTSSVPSTVLTDEAAKALHALCLDINASAHTHGFWDTHNISEKLCLIHSEISEALEASRKDINAPDHHVPRFTNFTVELADAIIRAIDLAYEYNLPIVEAILAKHEYNKSRPFKHGKKF